MSDAVQQKTVLACQGIKSLVLWGSCKTRFMCQSKYCWRKSLITSLCLCTARFTQQEQLAIITHWDRGWGTYAAGQCQASLHQLCSAGPRGQRIPLRCFCSPMCTGLSWLSGSAAEWRKKKPELSNLSQYETLWSTMVKWHVRVSETISDYTCKIYYT